MRRAPLWTLIAGLASCASAADRTPVWALDTITLDPEGAAATALQAWTLHDARWEKRASRRALVCSAIVELTLEPGAEGCDDCDVAYEVTARRVADTDCDDSVLKRFVLLERTTAVGIGPLPAELEADSPLQGALGGRVRVADTWLDHGWAYPAGADAGDVDPGPWDGVRTFTLEPGWAWDLGDTTRAPTARDTDAAVEGLPAGR